MVKRARGGWAGGREEVAGSRFVEKVVELSRVVE